LARTILVTTELAGSVKIARISRGTTGTEPAIEKSMTMTTCYEITQTNPDGSIDVVPESACETEAEADRDTMTLSDVHIALVDSGHELSTASTDDVLYLAVSVDDDADEQLDAIRAIVEPLGAQADWTGGGNTNARGITTSDVGVTMPD